MKKSSLMGASVVAAALLAVAPIAAPAVSAVSGTQVVKADNDPTDAQKDAAVVEALKGFSQTKSQSLAASGINDKGDFDKQQGKLSDFLTVNTNTVTASSKFAALFQKSIMSSSSEQFKALKAAVVDDNYKINVTYSDGTNSLNNNDLDAAINNITANNNQGTLQETVNVTAQDASGNTRTVATLPMTLNLKDDGSSATPSPVDQVTAIYVTGKTEFTPVAGDKTYPYTLSSSFKNQGGEVLDQNGNDLIKNGVVTEVKAGSISDKADVNHAAVTDFKAGKTYTQDITVHLNGSLNLDKANVNYDPQVEVGTDSTDGTRTVTFTRTFTVPADASKPVNDPDNTDAKEEAVDGVVVINSDVAHGNAQLYDEAGNAIPDWVLPAGTPWYTGMKRTTLKDGQVYYQVSTHAYVKASQVKYIPEADWQAQTAKADITNVNGVFTVKVDGSDILPLKTVALNDAQNSFVSSDRVLNGGTSWAVDQKAVLNGETYYRVSTNLWVRASSNGISNGNFVER